MKKYKLHFPVFIFTSWFIKSILARQNNNTKKDVNLDSCPSPSCRGATVLITTSSGQPGLDPDQVNFIFQWTCVWWLWQGTTPLFIGRNVDQNQTLEGGEWPSASTSGWRCHLRGQSKVMSPQFFYRAGGIISLIFPSSSAWCSLEIPGVESLPATGVSFVQVFLYLQKSYFKTRGFLKETRQVLFGLDHLPG